MSKICPLFSGSTGNSTYIEGATGAVLADVGMSCKAVTDALQYVGGDTEKISAVVITHEHIDHIKGLKPFLNTARQAMLISTAGTLEALETGGENTAAHEGPCYRRRNASRRGNRNIPL